MFWLVNRRIWICTNNYGTHPVPKGPKDYVSGSGTLVFSFIYVWESSRFLGGNASSPNIERTRKKKPVTLIT